MHMPNLTIENFWKLRLRVARVASASLIQGWSLENSGLDTFKEAPLAQNTDFGTESDLDARSIIIVSAPGAVGKSTLARQIAFATGAVYVDLAKAEPVGANTLSGGLVKSGLYSNWEAQNTAILIDGLDEARLRVTQEAFEAFLSDIAGLSKNRTVPTVLFGRTGAALDTWLALAGRGADVSILEIGYYGPQASVEFAEARLRAARPNSQHQAVERKALELLLQGLRDETESDGDRFAGYAPVLQAVADRVGKESNPSALIEEIKKGSQPVMRALCIPRKSN
jgi:hypothetical protein